MGALGFGFETPEEAQQRIEYYWELVREECMPIGAAINPAVTALGAPRHAVESVFSRYDLHSHSPVEIIQPEREMCI